jgi:hypothetical protein
MNKTKGVLFNSLNRNSGQVKKDRADMIHTAAERYYRRQLEDIRDKIKELEITRDAQLDMSPDDINKIISPAAFDAKGFFETDASATMQIRELEIKLQELEKRYTLLFGIEEQAAVAS